MTPHRQHDRKHGQVMIFLIMVLVALVFVVLWNFDLHKILFVKSRTQNAGDAAALMGARWQGITLNLIGDLNLMHAVALAAGNAGAAESITNIQARVCYVGPMIGFFAAQQAAKNNGIFVNDAFTAFVREHADTVRYDYPYNIDNSGNLLFPEPYPGCWEEYADMLELAANDGIAVGADNARFYTDRAGDHTLLNLAFYESIAGRNWCWFYHHEPGLLTNYQNFNPGPWWEDLPPLTGTQVINAEFFGLSLSRQTTALDQLTTAPVLNRQRAQRGVPGLITTNEMAEPAVWYTYGNEWHPWTAMDTDGEFPFPGAGTVRPQYNYAGADAVTRTYAKPTRLTPGPGGSTVTNHLVWIAAAKPFGYLPDQSTPMAYRLVLPAFHNVRLIPVDASSRPSGGRFDIEWRIHQERHLPDYMEHGPGAMSADCWYCRQLIRWENRSFRRQGERWLDANSDDCTRTGGGGGGPGGGRRIGH